MPFEVQFVGGGLVLIIVGGLGGQAARFVRRGLGPTLVSAVPGHEGQCRPTWTNSGGGLFARLDGGVTGFFRRVHRIRHLPGQWPYGPEFHGIIRDGVVYSTEGIHS